MTRPIDEEQTSRGGAPISPIGDEALPSPPIAGGGGVWRANTADWIGMKGLI